ncbi:MAG: N-acetylgalactosamine-6-sulfatase [Planctomycetaceae bacterium]|nr:N-acetylgalactosamine-6-sulfatase [Planctomycetaceae bacterium]
MYGDLNAPARTLCLLLGLSALPAAEARAEEKPNIIFIMADDLGYGDLGCYGQTEIKTPRIDRLASEGMRFTDFYAGSTVCAPSRCVLMTGYHTGHAFVRGNRRLPLRPEELTVAEVLKKKNYTTGIIGKWGLGEPGTTGIPNRQGFDYWFGYLNQRHAHNYYPEFLFKNEDKVKLEGNVVKATDPEGAGVATRKVTYSHDLMATESLSFIDHNKARRFFLYLPFTIPHANNEARNEGMEVPSLGIYANKDWPEPQKALAAMISLLDRDVGRILDRLEKHGIAENTVFMFTSDNGPHSEGGNESTFFKSSGGLRGQKRDLYDGGVRVPLIVRWPGKVKAGSTSSHIGSFQDFLLTAAELAGAEAPTGTDGISFVPTLLGKKQKQHSYLYWEFYEGGYSQAVRMGNYKGVRRNTGQPVELYDVTSDIGEHNDLAAANPAIVEKVLAAFEEAHTPSPHWKARVPEKKSRPKKTE